MLILIFERTPEEYFVYRSCSGCIKFFVHSKFPTDKRANKMSNSLLIFKRVSSESSAYNLRRSEIHFTSIPYRNSTPCRYFVSAFASQNIRQGRWKCLAHFHPHAAARAFYNFYSRVDIVCVEILHFLFRNLPNLCF